MCVTAGWGVARAPQSAADVDWGGAEVALYQFLSQELLPLLPHRLLDRSEAGTQAPFHLIPSTAPHCRVLELIPTPSLISSSTCFAKPSLMPPV